MVPRRGKGKPTRQDTLSLPLAYSRPLFPSCVSDGYISNSTLSTDRWLTRNSTSRELSHRSRSVTCVAIRRGVRMVSRPVIYLRRVEALSALGHNLMATTRFLIADSTYSTYAHNRTTGKTLLNGCSTREGFVWVTGFRSVCAPQLRSAHRPVG